MISYLVLPPLLMALASPHGVSGARRTESPGVGPGVVMLTDTAEYCASLVEQILSHGPVPAEAQDLFSEGQAMCARGEWRGGVHRLRRVSMIQRRIIGR